jgi:hypothetical protein
MLDDDDASWVGRELVEEITGPWQVAVLILIVFVVVCCVVAMNHRDCEKKICPSGVKPKLISSECLCVEKPK